MLRMMLLMSLLNFDRLRHDYDDTVDIGERKEMQQMQSLLKESHPYDSWVNFRQVQDLY